MPDNELQAGLDSFLAKESEFKATTLRNNWANSAGTSPEDFAKQIALSRATGIPAQSLAADPEEAQRHAALQGTDFTGLVTSAPQTANFLLDQKNAGLYRDKAPELSALEHLMAGASYLGGSTVAGLHDLAGAGAKLLDAVNPFTLSDEDAAVLFKDQPEKLQQMREKSAAMGLSRFARGQTESSNKRMEAVSPEAKATYGGLKYATTDTGEAAYLSPIKVISDALRSLPTSAALAATVVLTRGAALKAETAAAASGATAAVARQAGLDAATNMAVKFGAASEGSIGYAQQALQTQNDIEGMPIDKLSKSPEFQKLLEQGYDPNVARIFTAARAGEQAGVGAGFVDALTNAIGGKFLGKIVGEGGKLVPRILKGFANEAGVEFVQSGGEQLFENIAKQANANPNQALSENVVESMLQGLFVGGLTGGAFSGILGRAANETAVEGDAQHLADLFAAAAQVHDRDPETFKQFFQTIAPNATVLIDPEKLQEVLLQANIDPAKLPSFMEQANTSQAGPGIEIPVHELVAAFTGTGAEAALIPHIRFGADAPTLAETREAGTKAADFFQKEADRILEEQSRNEEFVAGAKAVQDDVKAQLDALGRFGPQATSGYAALTGAFYTTMASQLGITPLQLRDGWTDAQGVARRGYKLSIGGTQNAATAQSLNQLQPATQETFTKAGIPNLLKTDNWTILTAENPNAQQLSPEENAARNAELQQYLTAQGYDFTPVKGHYGQPENSFVVTGISPEQAQALAKKFEQESVLTRHGLVYQDGSITPANGLTVHPSQPEDFYTKLPDGTTFTVGLNFDAPRGKLSEVLGQTARDFQTVTPAQIDAIRKAVAWTETGTENGFPVWKNAQVALTSPVDVTDGHDVFYKPLGNERAVKYQIQDAKGRSVGYTVLELAEGWPTLLLDIEVAEKERGNRYAEQTVAAIANDVGELGIWHVIPSARSWWERIGAAPVDEHNGTIDFNGYADARASRENTQGVGHGIAFNQSQSSRRPTTKRAPEDHLGEVPLTVDYTKIEPDKTAQNMALVSKYPGLRFKARDAAKRAEEFIQHVTSNLLWLHDQIPAEIRQRSKLWYDGARQITDRWAAKYGKSDAQIAAILAVYSPQKDWFMNVSLAERTLDIVKNQQDFVWDDKMSAVADGILAKEQFALLRSAIEGKTLGQLTDKLEQAAWLRTFDEAHDNRSHRVVTPEGGFSGYAQTVKGAETKTGWPGFATIVKALYIMEDGSAKTIDAALGGEHKVRSFYNNIFHPNSDLGFVTIDTHAVAAGLLRPLSGNSLEVTHNFGSGGAAQSATTGMSGTYPYYQEAYRRAAEARGLLPREMQSITWEAVRELYTMGFKHDKAKLDALDNLWSEYEKGKRSLDDVRAQVLKLAGGIERPAWVGRDPGLSAKGWASTYTSELLGSSAPGREGAAAGRAGDAAAGTVQEALNQSADASKPGAVAGPVVGVHFSREKRGMLSSSAFGTGVQGAERERLAASGDPRLKQRIAFYVSNGKGVFPEAGVGGAAHIATLTNLYDADADALKLFRNNQRDSSAAESAVLDAGFDGYLRRDSFTNQGTVVMLGSRGIAAEHVGGLKEANAQTAVPPPAQIPALKAAAIALANDKTLPGGALTPAQWKAKLEARDPQLAAQIDFGMFKADEPIYKDQLSGALWQQAKDMDLFAAKNGDKLGSFNPNTLDLRLLADANLSTFLHETGHFFLTVYADLASQPDAPEAITKGMAEILKQFGIADVAAWQAMPLELQRPFHEQFAESFEQYLFTGKAPSLELQPLFQRFASWLTRVYVSIKDFIAGHPGAQLNPELSAVFDRMLATENEIAAANAARGFAALFKDAAEAGMTDKAFAAYTALSVDQKTDAEEMLRTRGLRDMKWLQNRRNKVIAELQADAKEKRDAVMKEVAAEVAATPLRKAMRWLKRGEMTDADGTEIKAPGGNKLQISELEAMFPEGALVAQPDWKKLGYGQYGMLAAEGLSPDLVAEMFGLPSGQELVSQLLGATKFADEVNALADQRMLEQYGDLSSQDAISRAADEAIHNDARTRMVATELSALAKNVGAPSVLMKAAREYARQIVETKSSKTLKPWGFAAAETRAGKAALAALRKGDRAAAASEKRTELVNHVAAKEAYAAEKEIKKIVDRFKAIVAYKDDSSSVKTRDADIVNAVRAILSDFGIGTKGKSAREYLAVVQANNPDLAAVLSDTIDAVTAEAKAWQELPLAKLRGLSEEINGLWFLAKRSKQVEIDGRLIPMREAQDAIHARLVEIGIPDHVPGEGSAVTATEKRGIMFDRFVGALRRVEAWAGAKDGALTGPFRKFMWNPVRDAADAYRADKVKYLKAYRDLLKPIAPTLTRQMIDAPELGYVFGKDESGLGKAELLHAILHTGNESNKRKLLLGRGWATEQIDKSLDTSKWDAFIKRMENEGKITKADYDFAQGVWDLMEGMKPLAQKAHRDVFGRYFSEVSADTLKTRFGDYRGGYVPALTDPLIVRDADLRALAETENSNMAFAFPATTKGFTKSRVESYAKPLKLDLRALSQHIDKVLLFSHMTRPVNDVRRMMSGKAVAQALGRVDPQAYNTLVIPWLNRAAKQTVETQTPGREGLGRFWSVVRGRAGMAAMFGNVANAVQQVTGLALAAVRVRPVLLLDAMAKYAMSPSTLADQITGKSAYMATRLENEVSMMSDQINDILLNPTIYENAKNWTNRHAYFLQSAVDSVISPVVWLGGYNQAIEAGLSEAEAVRAGDSAVRETQGSTAPEDIASFETGTAFYRMFVQFAGYFNMNANLLGNEYVKITRDMGLRAGAGRGLYVLVLGFLAPAIVGELIMQVFKGGPEDDDKDGEYLDDWLMTLFAYAPARYLTAMVPVVGQVGNAAINALNNKPYDDRISTAPAISMIESALKAPQSVYKAIAGAGKPSRAIKDVATLLSMTVGIPASAAARPISYLSDVADNRVAPTGPVDLARGTITGVATPESKR